MCVDTAAPTRPSSADRALELDDGCVGVLQGQESKPAEAIRMLGDNRRGLVIDVASHVDAVADINLVTPQRRGEGDQLPIDPQAVHVGDPVRDRGTEVRPWQSEAELLGGGYELPVLVDAEIGCRASPALRRRRPRSSAAGSACGRRCSNARPLASDRPAPDTRSRPGRSRFAMLQNIFCGVRPCQPRSGHSPCPSPAPLPASR